jgi:hypothetical protein
MHRASRICASVSSLLRVTDERGAAPQLLMRCRRDEALFRLLRSSKAPTLITAIKSSEFR